MPAAARIRAPIATLGFFDEMKKGFEAGMGASSTPQPPPPAKPVEADKESAPSFFDEIKKGISAAFAEPTPEERKASGEGVVWSADYSRCWRSMNQMPQNELSLEEGKELAELLDVEIPPEALARMEGP